MPKNVFLFFSGLMRKNFSDKTLVLTLLEFKGAR